MSRSIVARLARVALLCPLCLPPVAGAERLSLDPVAVTVARAAMPLSTTPAGVTLIDRQALEALGSMPLEDVLLTQAGVTLGRNGGAGQQASLFLRGTDSDSTLVLVDGVKYNAGTFGGAAVQNLRAADIERIEVVRGPRSTLYGSEAIGGVVSITTRRAGADRTEASVGAGSDDTLDLHGAIARQGNDSAWSLGASRFRTDGGNILDASRVTGRHDNTSANVDATTRTGQTRWRATGWLADGTTRYVDLFSMNAQEQQFSNAVAALEASRALSAGVEGRLRAGYAKDDLEQSSPGDTDFATTTRHTLAAEIEKRRANGDVLVAGLDAEREDVDALVYGSPLAADRDQWAAFVRESRAAGPHRMALGFRRTDHDSFGDHWNGEASYGYVVSRATFFWLAWGSGFRAPDSTELNGWGGNPDLAPETTDAWEAGVRHVIGNGTLTLIGYRQKIADLIDYPAPSFTATNIDRARIEGIETGWHLATRANRVDALAILQDPVDATTGDTLSRRPERQFTLSARHALRDSLWLGAELLAMDARDNSRYDSIVLPGFAVVDLTADWAFAREWTLRGRLRNAFDRDYVLASGSAGDYLMPGRGVFIAIDWRR